MMKSFEVLTMTLMRYAVGPVQDEHSIETGDYVVLATIANK